ncbi:MAG TPA: replication factor C large subunit [Candidatus Methanomethylophilaceae archaeon]|nr:replication factor C large subunit [Candidatus Methanomethylophilaceae archaeon]
MSKDWTEIYRPHSLSQLVGNPKAVEDIAAWADSWERSVPSKRALVLMGPPGIGKTSAALALAEERGWGVVEINASDQRNGEILRQIALRGSYSNTFSDNGEYLSVNTGGRKLIILDEADCLFGNEDRGAVPVIVELIKKTLQPVILIVNDFYALSKKSNSIRTQTKQVRFYPPRNNQIVAVLSSIARDQGLSFDREALNIIAENAKGDVRAAIRDFQSLALGRDHLSVKDVMHISARNVEADMYELMDVILRGNDPEVARKVIARVHETPETILLWLDENMPYEYRQAADLERGYERLSRADIYLGRVSKRQYYGFWSYANEMMSFALNEARRGRPARGEKFRFPSYLLKMSRSKASRKMKSGLAAKIAEYCHTSISRAYQEILPYLSWSMRNNPTLCRALTQTLELDAEELAYLLDEAVDSEVVKAPLTQQTSETLDVGSNTDPKTQKNLFDF